MKRSEILFGILRIPLDAMAVFAALVLSYWLRSASIDLLPNVQLLAAPGTLPTFDYYITNFALPAVGGYVVIAAALGLYSLKSTLGPWREVGRTVLASALWVALVMAWFFLVQRQLFFSRVLLAQSTFLITVFALMLRTCMILVQRMFLRYGVGTRTVLSCGTSPLPGSVYRELETDVRYKYLGHVNASNDVGVRHEKEPLDLVLHTDPNPVGDDARKLIEYCRSRQIGYAYVPPVFTDVPHQLSIGHLGLVPILRFEPTPLDGWGRVWKRMADAFFGTMLLLLLSPILLLTALVILVTCGLPVFYVSKRVGQYGRKSIPLIKFRTMCRDADAKKHEVAHMSHRTDGPLFKIKNDPRVTPIGKILRRLSIDELPQLFNVIAGHLSLVGPRPHLPDEVAKYSETERRVFTVRPGATGLAQISGRSDLSFQDEMRLDMRYIEDWSFGLDLWILWRTIFVVLFGKGAD